MASKSKERHAHGGVSSGHAGRPLVGVETVADLGTATNKAALHSGFKYHGGPIVKCPQIITSFWGAWSDAAHQARATRLNQFITDLLKSRYMNIMTQYGCGFGAGAAGAFIKATFLPAVPANLTEASIHSTIQSCINAGAFPEPTANSVLIIYLSEGIGVQDAPNQLVLCEPAGDTAFGYHSFFTTTAGHDCYYAIIPALTNSCLTESCASDAGCSLHLAQTQEQRQTQVTSHEFAEMISDPKLNAWFDDGGAGENGDICNGQSDTITVGPNTWTVQRMYSKFDDIASNGAAFCVVAPPNPLPKLSPGPAAATGGAAVPNEPPLPFDRLLPLPTATIDLKKKSVTMDQAELRSYVNRVFHPLEAEHVIADLPEFLRSVASMLEKAKK